MQSFKQFLTLMAVIAAVVCMTAGAAFAFHGYDAAITDSPKETTRTQTLIITTQIKNRTKPVPTFTPASGDEAAPGAAWGNTNLQFYSYSRNKKSYNSKTLMLTGGYDVEMGDFLLGAAASLERSRATDHNNAKFKDWGIGLIPYVAYSPMDWLVIDTMAGYTYLDNHLSDGTGNDDYAGYRTFASANINGYFDMSDSFVLNPFVGYTYSQSHIDSISTTGLPAWSQKMNAWAGYYKLGLGGLYGFSEVVDLDFGLAYYYQNIGGSSTSYAAGGVRDRDYVEPYLNINFQVSDDFRASIQSAISYTQDHTDTGNIGLNFEWAF